MRASATRAERDKFGKFAEQIDRALSLLDAPGGAVAEQEIDRIIARLDAEIPEAHRSMDELLSRLRTTRIAA
jgi:hypothetical protein